MGETDESKRFDYLKSRIGESRGQNIVIRAFRAIHFDLSDVVNVNIGVTKKLNCMGRL